MAREFAAMIIAEVAELDARLEKAREKVVDFDARVSESRAESAAASRRVQRWIIGAAIVVMGIIYTAAKGNADNIPAPEQPGA